MKENKEKPLKLLIWGIGEIEQQLDENELNGEIVGYIETKKSVMTYNEKKVYSFWEIPEEYDYIIVANSHTDEICDLCLKSGIDTQNMIFWPAKKVEGGLNDDELIKNILGNNYTYFKMIRRDRLEGTFFNEDMEKYQQLNKRPSFSIRKEFLYPLLLDKSAKAGTIDNYFWQDLWAAKLVYKSKAKKHFDIGSRIDGFIAHLLAMGIDVSMIDIREFPCEVENLHTIVDDATRLKNISDGSINSMSALCSLEHFGLGRYGDPVDPEACFTCFNEIQRCMAPDGNLYISVPVGKERVEFNAHRVFYASTVVECFASMELLEYSCAADDSIKYNVPIDYNDKEPFGTYMYGLFHFKKGN